MNNSKQIVRFWREFCEFGKLDADTSYEVWHFGNTPEMAEKLLQLVLAETKQAATFLVWAYDSGSKVLPTLDKYDLITDWNGNPAAVLQPTEIRILPFNKVDADFAFDEGEGDRSLDYWRRSHWEMFSETCAEMGKKPELTMPVCCIRFKLVYSG